MKPKAIRRLSVSEKEKISQLATLLNGFLPLSIRGNKGVSFKSIFAESKIQSYLEGFDVKKRALENGFIELIRRHQRLPKIIIGKIILASIDYRNYKRNPLTQEELNSLSDYLYVLQINMRDEIAKVKLDSVVPPITVAPKDLQEFINKLDIADEISREPVTLFTDGHFNEAVRKAAEIFEKTVQNITDSKEIGRTLMASTFKRADYIDFSIVSVNNQKSFIDGYKFLAMGLFAAPRNIFSHGHEDRREPEEALEMFLMVNWLFRYLKR